MSDDTIVPFRMARSPGLAPDSLIHQLSEQDRLLLNAETILSRNPFNMAPQPQKAPEHPLAAKLYRDFKAGSQIMTKTEAWKIGNELDSLLKHNLDLHAEMAAKIGEARATVARLLAQIEQLRCQKNWECLDPNGHDGPCTNVKETN